MNRSPSLNLLLNEIVKQRCKLEAAKWDQSNNKIVTVDNDFFWTKLYKSNFLDNDIDQSSRDDLLFFVGKSQGKNYKPDLRVFRRFSPNLPTSTDNSVNWEKTVYLNLILHYFVYVITLGICTRSGAQEIEILKKCSQTVYASPSFREMDVKGKQEKIVYPHLVFAVDNFEEVFSDCILRDSECLCVELTAYDRFGALQGVLFEGVVRYSTLKTVHDIQTNQSSLSNGNWKLGSNHRIGESGEKKAFIRMLAPHSAGMAEVVVRQIGGSKATAISSTGMPGFAHRVSSTTLPRHGCRISCEFLPTTKQPLRSSITYPDTSVALNPSTESPAPRDWLRSASVNSSPTREHNSLFVHPSDKSTQDTPCLASSSSSSTRISRLVSRLATGLTSPSSQRRVQRSKNHNSYLTFRKARSDSGNLDKHLPGRFRSGGRNFIDVDATNFEEEFEDLRIDDSPNASVKNEAFGQAWQWFKERRRITSAEMNVSVTYVSLPWHLIIAGILEAKKTPVLTSTFMDSFNESN